MLRKTHFRHLIAGSMLALMLPVAAQAQTVCSAYQEAPELAARVAAGELPPAAERLLADPIVLTAASIGTYGGTLYDIYDGNRLAEFRKFGYENLVRWNADGSQVIPNIAESWDVNADASAYTFHLRDGIKWSDGQPFTADDILFWWERVETNTDINPGGPYSFFIVEGQAATVTKVDDLTVTFSWDNPNGLFLSNLATSYGVRVTQFPKHYLEQFDNQSNPEGVAAMMAAAGQTEYGTWWISRVGSYGNPAEYNDPARPSMQAWIATAPYIGAERFTFVRNPYYFKVDGECNQLPYIGERTFTLATDPEVMVLKTMSGEDYLSRDDVSSLTNRGVLFENQENGNYHLVDAVNSNFNTLQIHLELTKPDPVQAGILNNRDFRIGMSLAMDRQTVIDLIFLGDGEPWQQAPRPDSAFYNETLAKQYTDFDPALANEYLDKVMPEKDAEGFRLRPDGQRFTFAISVNATRFTYILDALQLFERNWADVGIKVELLTAPDTLWFERRTDPNIDAYTWIGENGSARMPLLAALSDAWTPEAANGWIAWRQRQANPEASVAVEPVEPPESVKRQYEIMSELNRVADTAEQDALMTELLNISAENFYTIGVGLPAGDYKVVNNTLKNVPDDMLLGWLYPGPAPVNFETFYIDKSAAN